MESIRKVKEWNRNFFGIFCILCGRFVPVLKGIITTSDIQALSLFNYILPCYQTDFRFLVAALLVYFLRISV